MDSKVTALKPQAYHEDIYRSLLENNYNVIYKINTMGAITYISSTIKHLTGFEPNEVIGKHISKFIIPEDFPLVQERMNSIYEGNTAPIEFRIVYKDGETRYARTTSLTDIEGGKLKGLIGIITDISERKETTEQLKRYALYDLLTGLHNRNYFQEELSRRDHFETAGIITCDIDGLKLVNDTLGHDKGNSMLTEAAAIIKNCFTESDMVARISGDEFAAVFYNVTGKEIEAACNRLRAMVRERNSIHEDMPLSLSIGYAVDDSTTNLEELFGLAENNMYREKLHRSKSGKSAVVQTLMKTLKEKDFITEGHADRLQDLVIALAHAISLPEYKISDLRLLAQFHDIGKVAVPDSVLMKPKPLTKKETDAMRRHSEIGYRIAMASPDLAPIAEWILKHHEWWDGSGYPLGLKGEEIPLECRILAIADAYDAMTSDRPYREARSKEEAIEELRRFSGRQFVPELVEKFIEII